MADAPTGIVDTSPTFLVGGNANNNSPAIASVGDAGRTLLAASDASTARNAISAEAAGAAAAVSTASCQKSANLSDVNSVSTARTNLGLGTAATVAVSTLLQVANNLSDVNNPATARNNILPNQTGNNGKALITDGANASWQSLGGGGDLLAANNLSDLANKPAALTNLGIGEVVPVSSNRILSANDFGATLVCTGNPQLTINTGLPAGFGCLIEGQYTVNGTATVTGTIPTSGFSKLVQDGTNVYKIVSYGATGVLLAANNLSDVASASTARTNLGLGTSATQPSTAFAQVANNLSDLSNTATARTNLGLGTAATLASSAVLQSANNLSDLNNPSTALVNIGAAPAMTVKNGNFTAADQGRYVLVATATITDPPSVLGATYQVLIQAGTATIGGQPITAGALVFRSYNGSAWQTFSYGTLTTPVTNLTDPNGTGTVTVPAPSGPLGRFNLVYGPTAGIRTLAFTGLTAGASGIIMVTQNSTGGDTLLPPAGAKTPNGSGIMISLTGSAISTVSYYYDGTTLFISAGPINWY